MTALYRATTRPTRPNAPYTTPLDVTHNVALRAARYLESRYLSGRQVGVCGLPHWWELSPIGGIFAGDHPGVGGVFEAHP